MPSWAAARRVQFSKGVCVSNGRDDEAALVPDAHDHVGECDFLDGAGFLLLAGDDDVAHAYRVGEGQLQAGEDVAEGLLGGETEDHRDDAGGGQHGGHGLAGDFEGTDDRDDAHNDDDRLGEAAQHLGLGLEAARASLVRILAGLGGVLENPRGCVGHPGQAGEGDDEQHVHEERRDRRAVPVGQVGVDQRDAESRPRSPGREREVPGRRTRARIDEAVAALESALRARAERRTERTIPTKAPTSGPRIRRVRSMVVATAASAPDCGSAIARVRASEAWARAPSADVIVMHQA